MKEILSELESWHRAGEGVALATVVAAWGSSPRPLGAKMAISTSGQMAGSVSGGCVEGAVADEAGRVLAGGGARLLRYGITDESAWSVGLSCGGTLEVFVQPLDLESQISRGLLAALSAERTVIVATAVGGPATGSSLLIADGEVRAGSLGAPGLDVEAVKAAAALNRARRGGRRQIAFQGESHDVFFDVHLPPPRLVIVGAVHAAVHLVAFARRLGFHVTVIDPRTAFATAERFPAADELITDWPQSAFAQLDIQESTCFAFLSHDPKIDLPGLERALRSPALYVGALGSRKTHARRCAALRERGLSDGEISRLRSPIGLDLGGRRAEEIALAVIAEIVAVHNGRDAEVGSRPESPR